MTIETINAVVMLTVANPTAPATPVQAVQFNYKAMENVPRLLKRSWSSAGGAGSARILGSKLLTDLINSWQLCYRRNYSNGELEWYLMQNGLTETINDTDYLVRFPSGNIMVVSEKYFKLNFN